MTLSNRERQQHRADAQRVPATVQVGKGGVRDTVVQELDKQLRERKLVKARLLPASTEGGTAQRSVAEGLAEATKSDLVDVRGHTAVFYRR